MARKRELAPHVIEVKLEEEQPAIESSDGDEEVSEDEENEEDEEENEENEENEDEDEEDEDEDEEDEEDEENEEEEDEDDDEDEELEDVEEENNQVEDEEEDFSSKESIRKILEPFGKDQLMELLKEAVLKNPSLLNRIVSETETDPAHRNIFVHGLSWDVTSETLAAAFSPFGELEDCRVVTDLTTGQCKGYGFVVFRSRAAVQRALKKPLKKIGGCIAKCRIAYLHPTAAEGKDSADATGRKLYVTNVGINIKPERLLAFFSKFGEIEKGPYGFDPTKGKVPDFAFIIYKTVEGLNKALEEPWKYLEGCKLLCRKGHEVSNKTNNTQIAPVLATETMPSGLKTNDLTLSYASAAALMGQNLAPGQAVVIGPNVGVGLLNPLAGLSPALSGRVAAAPHQPYMVGGVGIPPQSYAVGPVGSANRGSGISVNSISPSVIGSYGSVAALHGLGAYQNSAPSAAMRRQSGIGSLGASGLAPFYTQ